MKKIAIFPFDYYLLPVIKNKDNFLDFQLSQVFSLQGWGMVNDTVSVACKDDTAEDIVVMDIFDESIDFDRLLQAMEYKFSVETDCIYISSISKDPFSLNKITPIEYVLYNNDFTTTAISQIAYDSCPQFDRNTYEKLYQFAVDKLHGYNDLQVM